MKKVKITVMKKARYDDLIEKYENPLEHECDVELGDVFAIEIYGSSFLSLKSEKQTQKRRFPASGGPYYRDVFPRFYFQAHTVNNIGHGLIVSEIYV